MTMARVRARFGRSSKANRERPLQPGLVMQLQTNKRVAVAITANGGNTLCGFCTTASPRQAEKLFASSVSRLRRAGQVEEAPVVLSIDTTSENYESLWVAEQELERALDLPSTGSPTAEHVLMR